MTDHLYERCAYKTSRHQYIRYRFNPPCLQEFADAMHHVVLGQIGSVPGKYDIRFEGDVVPDPSSWVTFKINHSGDTPAPQVFPRSVSGWRLVV